MPPSATLHHAATLSSVSPPFELSLAGASSPTTALIMIHGFGVRRDSRGLFTDLEQRLLDDSPHPLLILRPDFSLSLPTHTQALPFTTQRLRIEATLDFVSRTFHPDRVVFLTHSQGILPLYLTRPCATQIIALAPPFTDPFARFIGTPGWARPGSHLDLKATSRLERSDGSITLVDPTFWPDLQGLDTDQVYRELSTANQLYAITAGADQVLVDNLPPNYLKTALIPNADHDFSAAARLPLLDVVSSLINS